MTDIAIRLVVHGRVQGVGFRWFVQQEARARGLAGWVRNRPDGTVELAARGPRADVEDLRRVVAVGPPGAAVSRMDDHPADAADSMTAPFRIHHS